MLVPGAHGHAMDPAVDGPTFAPADDAAFQRKLANLQAAKAAAVAEDELELALHYKRTRSACCAGPCRSAEAGLPPPLGETNSKAVL